MKVISVLKFIDHWAGGPICLVLACFHRITHPFYRVFLRVSLKKPIKSVLVIKFFGLGSIVLASALLKSIKSKYPKAKLIFLTFKNNAELLKKMGLVDEVRSIDPANIFSLLYSMLFNMFYFSFKKPAITVDLEFFSKFSTIMSYLSGAKWRVGFYTARFWRNSLVNVPVYFNTSRHILEIYGMAAKAAGTDDIKDPLPGMVAVSQIDESHVGDILLQSNISEKDFILGVNINASDLAYCRRWPRKKFAFLIDELLSGDAGLKVVLTGNRAEKDYTSGIVNLLDPRVKDRVFDLAGTLPLVKFLALLKKLNLLVTNDSGALHLARAQQTPTVSIWGPGSAGLYGPYGKEKDRHWFISKEWPCSPCMYIYRTDAGYFCSKTAPCLKAVSVQECAQLVRKAVKALRKS